MKFGFCFWILVCFYVNDSSTQIVCWDDSILGYASGCTACARATYTLVNVTFYLQRYFFYIYHSILCISKESTAWCSNQKRCNDRLACGRRAACQFICCQQDYCTSAWPMNGDTPGPYDLREYVTPISLHIDEIRHATSPLSLTSFAHNLNHISLLFYFSVLYLV